MTPWTFSSNTEKKTCLSCGTRILGGKKEKEKKVSLKRSFLVTLASLTFTWTTESEHWHWLTKILPLSKRGHNAPPNPKCTDCYHGYRKAPGALAPSHSQCRVLQFTNNSWAMLYISSQVRAGLLILSAPFIDTFLLDFSCLTFLLICASKNPCVYRSTALYQRLKRFLGEEHSSKPGDFWTWHYVSSKE